MSDITDAEIIALARSRRDGTCSDAIVRMQCTIALGIGASLLPSDIVEASEVSVTDLQIAIQRVEAASVEMEAAIADLRRAGTADDLTLAERSDRERAHNRARRSVA